MPPSAVLGLIPLARQLPFVDHGVLDAEAERLAELGDLTAADGAVLLHGDFYLGNVLIYGDQISALIDLEFARMGPRDLELISVVRPSTRRPASASSGHPCSRGCRSPPRACPRETLPGRIDPQSPKTAPRRQSEHGRRA